MWKWKSKGLVVLAALVSTPTPASHPPTALIPSFEYPADARLDILRKFFAKSEAPAREVAHIFLQVADTYGLDWRLLPSISVIESGGGKTARNNNLFGWDSGRADFPSLTASIQAVAYRLAHSPLYQGKRLDEILSTYNPDAEYPDKVKAVMRSISPVKALRPRPAL